MPEPAFVRPVEAVSVTDRVTSEIRRAILGGRLRPGQEFSLRQIAAALGVSFIPVREALRSLEAEGLLVTRRGRSATVAPLDQHELESVTQLRYRIEPELAAQACQRHTGVSLDELDARLTRAMRASDNLDEWFDQLQSIYLDLLRPAATNWDLRVIRMLCRAAERYLRLGHGESNSSELSECAMMLRKVITQFRAADPEVARAATAKFVRWSEQHATRNLAAAS